MKTRLLISCVTVVAVSAAILFFVTNDVGGYSYVPIDCKIKNELGYFSKEDPLDPHSKEFADAEPSRLLIGCFKGSHPALFQ